MKKHIVLLVGIIIATFLSLLLSFMIFIPSIDGLSTTNRNSKIAIAVNGDNTNEITASSSLLLMKPAPKGKSIFYSMVMHS